MSVTVLLADVVSTCIKHGVEFSTVNSNMHGNCSGEFTVIDGIPKLIIATDKELQSWVEILIHESCHLDQYLEIGSYDKFKCADKLFDLLEINPFSREIPQLIIQTRDIELDCERRSLDKIYEYGLLWLIDPKNYIKKANAYLLFYTYMLTSRRWYDVPPYDIPEIVENCPDYFLNDYNILDDKLKDIYDRTYFGK